MYTCHNNSVEYGWAFQRLCNQVCSQLQRVAFDSSAAKTNESWQIEILERSADAKISW